MIIPPETNLRGSGLSGGNGVADVIQGSPPAAQVNYERAGAMIIRPLLFDTDGPCAFDLAKLFYAQYSEHSFEDDLIDYMRTGFVFIRPKMFAMAKVADRNGEKMWHVQLAIGNLIELLMAMPFKLKWICFCRNNKADQMRVCRLDRLVRLAARQALKGN